MLHRSREARQWSLKPRTPTPKSLQPDPQTLNPKPLTLNPETRNLCL